MGHVGDVKQRAIRWGFWGAGAIADAVAGDFPRAPGASLHAVASRSPERARRFALRHGIAHSYESLDALLSDAAIEVVYIATPNHRHAEDSLAALRAGKAVLCEKPFALNHAQATQVAEEARRRNLFCMEAMWTRFIPAIGAAKRSLDAGAIGAVRMMQGSFCYRVPPGAQASVFDRAQGGGALLDRGVYLVSLANYLLGNPQSIKGAATLTASGVDAQSVYQLTYADGALADFAASLEVRGTNEFLLSGERGMLRLNEPFYRAHRMVLRSFQPPPIPSGEQSGAAPAGSRRLVSSLRNVPMLYSLRRRMTPLATLLEARHAQTFPFVGNGYQFELMEVNECLRTGRIESQIMPLQDSLDILQTMDALRAQWGLSYPQEELPRPVEC